MNKTVQLVFVSLLSFSFVIVTIFVLLSAQGYNFDLNKRKIIETGGIYVKTAQPGAAVFIDGKYADITNSFTRDLLVQKLLPGSHNIKISREGYFIWEKDLSVDEKMVTKAQNIILFPQDISFNPLMSDIEEVFEIGNNVFLIQSTDGRLVWFDSAKDFRKDVLSAKEFKAIKGIKKIEFSPDKQKALISAKDGKYYLLSLDVNSGNLQLIEGLDKNISYPEFNGNSNIYHMSKGYLYSLNLINKKKELVKEEQVQGFALHGDGLYTLEAGLLIRMNVYIKTKEILTKAVFDFKKGSDYKLHIIEGRIFLIEDGRVFYYYNNEAKGFEKVIESTKEVRYRSWSDKVVFVTGNEIWLMLLKDFESPFFRKADSFIFLSRFSEKIDDIAWIDDDYFAVIIGGKIRISEIDIRDRINFFELGEENHLKVWFSKDEKALLVLIGGNLSKSTKILP
ncbi:MAG: hypothetical protein MNSN_07870 [Minisyncoccus archaeiphilus]|uniref:PEGA domain-containing protein n=1 Tax=Minisyncoccus archaeiphilus TaxID=3238481 RepID=UPI002B10FD1F|nr:MAG: hypothetical protein MNSN_07870 [Candidatus Parcubacteria bacterium]